jgi:demethoxyubiquinone hydroxylase (CLK1/Coq7/Cat5 family)
MSFTVKIHLTRSDKTVAELGDAQVAQQNQQARRRDGLLRLNDLSEKSTQAIVLGQLFIVDKELIMIASISLLGNYES